MGEIQLTGFLEDFVEKQLESWEFRWRRFLYAVPVSLNQRLVILF